MGKASGSRSRGVIALLAVVTAAALGAMLTPAHAVVPGQEGRILFTRAICETTCSWEIVTANADDTDETVVAGPYPREVWDDHFIANWSPDGTKVIFMADLGSGQGIWRVNADGTGLHEIFAAPAGSGLDDGPTFTPDGRYIVFTRCCPRSSGYGLWRINADGTGLRIVTTETVGPNVDGPSDNLPQVSPDGRTIAFHRNVGDCGCYIVTVNLHGGHLRQLTDLSLRAQLPNWSPDGTKIVFEMFPDVDGQGTANIATVNPDGTGLTQLTFNAPFEAGGGASVDPSWSPDGTRIIFRHCPSSGFCDLFSMNADGSGITQITKSAAGEFWPKWAPAP